MRSPKGGKDSDFEAVRLQARKLLEALDRGEVGSVYVFSGDDAFQRQALLRRVLAKLVPEENRDTRLTVLDGAAASARQVAGELESSGFSFDDEPRRVVLVRDCPFFQAGRADEAEPLRQRIDAGLLSDVVLVFEVRGKVDKRLSFSKTVAAVGTWLEFAELAGEADVEQFLTARLRRAGMTMTRGALSELITRIGIGAQGLTNEVDKLIAYVGTREEITVEDVEAMVAPTAELSVFELVDAVAERRPQAALDQLERLFAQQAEPFMILAMLIRQFRLLLQARYLIESGLADPRVFGRRPFEFNQAVCTKQNGRSVLDGWKEETAAVLPTEGKLSLLTQHYFPLWKTLNTARRLTTQAVEAALERLLQADLSLKSSHLDPAQEIELLVIDLCIRLEAGATVDYATILDI